MLLLEKVAPIILISIILVESKSRRGPFPMKAWPQMKNVAKVDEPVEKIVGGSDVGSLSERPFQVVMLFVEVLRCGGAIIGDKYVLTAAHCCDGISAEYVTIRVGSLEHASGGYVYEVAEMRKHEKYDYYNLSHDICILVTKMPITSTAGTAAVSLPPGPMEYEKGEEFIVSGWGSTSDGDLNFSDTLKAVKVPFVPDDGIKLIQVPSA